MELMLNPICGFKPTNRIQGQFQSKTYSTIKPTNRIQRQFHSKTDSTIKPTKRIQRQFHSKTDSTIKPTNRIQGQFHSKTDSTINFEKAIIVYYLLREPYFKNMFTYTQVEITHWVYHSEPQWIKIKQC